MNFEKTLLDAPIKRKRTVRDNKFYLVPSQKPLVPTPYVPPTPTPPKLKPRIKTRIQTRQRPVALPRNRLRQNRLPMKVRERLKSLLMKSHLIILLKLSENLRKI